MTIIFKKYLNNLFVSIAFFLIAILFFYYQESKITIDNLHCSLQKEIFLKENLINNYLKKITDFYKSIIHGKIFKMIFLQNYLQMKDWHFSFMIKTN